MQRHLKSIPSAPRYHRPPQARHPYRNSSRRRHSFRRGTRPRYRDEPLSSHQEQCLGTEQQRCRRRQHHQRDCSDKTMINRLVPGTSPNQQSNFAIRNRLFDDRCFAHFFILPIIGKNQAVKQFCRTGVRIIQEFFRDAHGSGKSFKQIASKGFATRTFVNIKAVHPQQIQASTYLGTEKSAASSFCCSPFAYCVHGKPDLSQGVMIEKITPVEHTRRLQHRIMDALPIQLPKLIPFCENSDRVRSFRG